MPDRPYAPATLPPRRAAESGAARRRLTPRHWFFIKTLLWLLALAPLLVLIWDTFTGRLPAEHVKAITHRTGWWALTLLTATLAITPLRYLTGWTQIVRLRRPVGLFAFFYATLHVLTYFGLDHFFALEYIIEDILERPFITVGFLAWLIMVPLAITSTNRWKARLGRRWQKLHRLVYASALLAVLHFYWLVKADIREPLIFAGILGVLLLFRVGLRLRRHGLTKNSRQFVV